MDETQEQLIKRLALLKQKIREKYPELTEKMSNMYVKNLQELEAKQKRSDNEER